MTILSIDPSLTHCGWVLFDENKTGKEAVLETGVHQTKPIEGLFIQRLITQRERFRLMIQEHKIKFVAMEAPHWDNFSTEILYAVHQHLNEAFLDEGIFLLYLQPSTVKKYAYPDMDPDRITKHYMIDAAKKELGLQKKPSEHVADAYFIGKIGLKFHQWYIQHKIKDEELSDRERDLFCGKHTYVKGVKKGVTEYTGIIYRENECFYDYAKQSRTSKIITKEVQDGCREIREKKQAPNVDGRVLQKAHKRR